MTFAGYPSRMRPECRMGRVGPLAVEEFYARFTGLRHAPRTWREWRGIPEHALAACTNGEVFMDARGDFSAWRKALLEYYPRDLWLKKLAARCMNMAQAGQYNLPRALRRGEIVCAMLAASRFAEAALGMLFLLNRALYAIYKWAWHIGRDLPFLGEYTADALKRIASSALVGSGGERFAARWRLCVPGLLRRCGKGGFPPKRIPGSGRTARIWPRVFPIPNSPA